MIGDLLGRVQTLQFHDRAAAEALLLPFVRETFPDLDVRSVELRPLAVSLNSFNGFLTLADGARLFFKTHTEPDNVIAEYYHAGELAAAGYPVLQPLYASREAQRQLLIYPLIDDPSVFDVAWEIETTREGDMLPTELLTRAQWKGDRELASLYGQTLAWQTAAEAAAAPIHQLFYHRLAGGRLERFYGDPARGGGADVSIRLPDGAAAMADARQAHWTINGRRYEATIDDLIEEATRRLHPAQAGASIIGHGDAHNGNVFVRGESLLYFDPAFAGRHSPLLDLVKPLFHNVFAMWMYFPAIKAETMRIEFAREGDTWHIDYQDANAVPRTGVPDIRGVFLESKIRHTLTPILRELRARGWLADDWRETMKAALFCCPFLTMNLADRDKFPPSIRVLGLAMAVEMGAFSEAGQSLIDRMIDEADTTSVV